jgi:Zn finger protein HypA/HybF involved in hydrogenase expression
MKTKHITCRSCKHKFEVNKEVHTVMCPMCENVLLVDWKPISAGDKLGTKGTDPVGRFR